MFSFVRYALIFILTVFNGGCHEGDNNDGTVVPIDGNYTATVKFAQRQCTGEGIPGNGNYGASMRTEDDGTVSFFITDMNIVSLKKISSLKLEGSNGSADTEETNVVLTRTSESSGAWSGEYRLRLNQSGSYCENKATLQLNKK